MKGNRWSNPSVNCPNYKFQSAQVIFCAGPEQGSSTHVAFSLVDNRKAYMTDYCLTNYEDCPYYRGLGESNNAQ